MTIDGYTDDLRAMVRRLAGELSDIARQVDSDRLRILADEAIDLCVADPRRVGVADRAPVRDTIPAPGPDEADEGSRGDVAIYAEEAWR